MAETESVAPAAPAVDESLTVVTLADLSTHNTEKDCWMAINGKVYDVTKFLDEHPGGFDIMMESAGKDATNEFEDVGHSETAKEMLLAYLVGQLPADEATVRAGRRRNTAVEGEAPSAAATLLKALIPVLLALVAYVIFVANKAKSA